MEQRIKFEHITEAGVWHKAPKTRSSLNEAIAALGTDCFIMNGNGFAGDLPNDAYTIAGQVYSTGGPQFGYAFNKNRVVYSYLNWQGYPDFIGGFRAYLSEGQAPKGQEDGTLSPRNVLGMTEDGMYIGSYPENTRIFPALERARKAGCITAINLDGGGSRQYYNPYTGDRLYGRDVINWVYFRIEAETPETGGNSMNVICNKKTYTFDVGGKQEPGRYIDPKDKCTIEPTVTDNLLIPIVYPAGGVQRKAYIKDLANFQRG